jgi:hypothetical protein
MADTVGRPKQRRRTRKDLLEAASQLMSRAEAQLRRGCGSGAGLARHGVSLLPPCQGAAGGSGA